jgi:predicted aminopeptidase
LEREPGHVRRAARRGAIFSQRSEADARKVLDEAKRREQRAAEFSQFLEPVMRELEALYALPISREEKLARREVVFRRVREDYLRRFPVKPGAPEPAFVAQPLNNAVLIAFAVYHRDTPEHERLFAKVGKDLRAFIRLYKRAVEDHPRPLEWLKHR